VVPRPPYVGRHEVDSREQVRLSRARFQQLRDLVRLISNVASGAALASDVRTCEALILVCRAICAQAEWIDDGEAHGTTR
jgi:hypothetical protein